MKQDSAKPFLQHLEELRQRLIRCLAVLFLLFVGANFFVDRIITHLSATTGVPFIFVHPTEAFFIRLRVAFFAGAFAALPYIIFEIWGFVGIALSRQERRWMISVLPVSYLLFCMGISLSWFVVLPASMKFFMGFSSSSLQPFISIDAFVGFAAWMTMAFGFLFQLPLVVLFLDRIGIVDIRTISMCRPHVVAALALLSAFLTPGPDPFSQLALLIPSYVLFECSLLVGRFLRRRKTLSLEVKQSTLS